MYEAVRISYAQELSEQAKKMELEYKKADITDAEVFII